MDDFFLLSYDSVRIGWMKKDICSSNLGVLGPFLGVLGPFLSVFNPEKLCFQLEKYGTFMNDFFGYL